MRLKKVLLAGLVVLVLCSAFTSAATKITVWMTYGGTMGEVVARLIEEDFTPKPVSRWSTFRCWQLQI